MSEYEHENSVSRCIQMLKDGQGQAATELWNRYFELVATAARRKLPRDSARVSDEEDVALSVFNSLCAGVRRGRFPKLNDRTDLWQVLLMLTQQKSVDQIRKEHRRKRGGGSVRGESVFLSKTNDGGAGLSHQPSDQASPDEVAELRDSIRKGLDLLEDEPLRQIAIARMRGLANQEIAEQQNLTVRSVERKLALIRDLWKEGLGR